MSVKNKQNSSVHFLVGAEFLTARSLDRPPLVITIPHSLNGTGVETATRDGNSPQRQRTLLSTPYYQFISGEENKSNPTQVIDSFPANTSTQCWFNVGPSSTTLDRH